MRRLLLWLVVLMSSPGLALVEPEATQLPPPGWMVDIMVAGAGNQVFCRGALIAPQWVLSAGACLNDPYNLLDNVAPGEDPEYIARIGPNGDAVEVREFHRTDDFTLGLFKIGLPSSATPLPLTTLRSAELSGQEVRIFGRQASSGIQHSYYNPSSAALGVNCRVEDKLFVGERAWCYLLNKPRTSFLLFQTRATVLNLAGSDLPATSLDKNVTPDKSGKFLYLDFRTSRSYPCNEDIGAPVLRTRGDGSHEIVGVVTNIGIASGLPICGISLANEFSSIDAIRPFIERTMAQDAFDTACPPAPKPRFSWQANGTTVRVQWSALRGATGYRVHYTDRHGHVPIRTVDLKSATSFTAPVVRGQDYLLAISAYNLHCGGDLSDPAPVYLAP